MSKSGESGSNPWRKHGFDWWHTSACAKWARLSWVMSREGADAWTLGRIYVAVVQAVMLYRSETWNMTPPTGRVLGGFHHRVARRMTRRQPQKVQDGGWVHPYIEETMGEAGLKEMKTCVYRRYNTVAQFIATKPIMELCLTVLQRPGSRVVTWCWKQDGLELEGMWKADW